MNKQIKLATYNIQFSQHPEKVINNILKMVTDGVSVICLQEVVLYKEKNIIQDLLHKLGSSWKAECNLGKEENVLSMGNCILWNEDAVSAESKHLKLLPYSGKLHIHEKVFSLLTGGIISPFRRRIIFIEFSMGKTNFCITNIHLDHNGGEPNRLKQLSYVKKLIKDFSTSEKEIICGDFNCFDLLKSGKENKSYQKLLGIQYTEATKKIGWTGDLYDIDTSMGTKFFGKIVRLLNIHIQRKLDFIWLKNIKSKDCHKLDLEGSDHKPVIVSLII